MKWKTLKKETILKNKFFKIIKEKCINGKGKEIPNFYIIEKEDAALITAFTEKNEVILVKQYRNAVKEISVEVPAGYYEESDKDATETIKRELLEETGFNCEKIIKLKSFYTSIGASNAKTHFFIGLNAKKIADQDLDNSEDIEIIIKPLEEVLEMIERNEIKSSTSTLSILLAKKYLDSCN